MRRRRARTGGLAGLAAAASLAVAVGVSSLRPTDAGLKPAEIQQAMARSQVLESALDRIDPESRVMDGQTAGIAQERFDRSGHGGGHAHRGREQNPDLRLLRHLGEALAGGGLRGSGS